MWGPLEGREIKPNTITANEDFPVAQGGGGGEAAVWLEIPDLHSSKDPEICVATSSSHKAEWSLRLYSLAQFRTKFSAPLQQRTAKLTKSGNSQFRVQQQPDLWPLPASALKKYNLTGAGDGVKVRAWGTVVKRGRVGTRHQGEREENRCCTFAGCGARFLSE